MSDASMSDASMSSTSMSSTNTIMSDTIMGETIMGNTIVANTSMSLVNGLFLFNHINSVPPMMVPNLMEGGSDRVEKCADNSEDESAPWQIARVVSVIRRLTGDIVGVAEVSSGVAMFWARFPTVWRRNDSDSNEGAYEGEIEQNP